MQKLLIVDDHQLFAEGIAFLIEQLTHYEVVSVVSVGKKVAPFLQSQKIDLILLDLNLPDMSGIEVLTLLRNTYPTVRILILSMLDDIQYIEQTMRIGASGYCLKNAGRKELFEAIQQVMAGKTYLPSLYFRWQKERKRKINEPLLSVQETKVTQLIATGNTTKHIAKQLFVSARTIETHRKNIYRKLGIHTNVELTVYAQKHYLI